MSCGRRIAQVRVEDLDQSQKSDVSGRYSRNGWDVLIAGFLPGAAMSLTRRVLADGISGSEDNCEAAVE